MSKSSLPHFTLAAPHIKVADIFRAAEYYRDVLGFSYDQLYGEPPSFCILRRDGLALMLSAVRPGEAPLRPTVGTELDFATYIWMKGVDAFHAVVASKGRRILRPPFNRDYGCREFEVADPDGNRLVFGEIIES